jgi:hypothetical protein
MSTTESFLAAMRDAKTSVPLIHLQSVRDFLNANLESGAQAGTTERQGRGR